MPQQKQARRVLVEVARNPKATPKTRLQAIELLQQPLPKLGGYVRDSVKALLWRLAIDSKVSPNKRLAALSTLFIKLAERKHEHTTNS